jgi:hypothetical protein
VFKEQQALKEDKVLQFLVYKVHKEYKDQLDFREDKAFKDHKVLKDDKVLQFLVYKVLKVFKVL